MFMFGTLFGNSPQESKPQTLVVVKEIIHTYPGLEDSEEITITTQEVQLTKRAAYAMTKFDLTEEYMAKISKYVLSYAKEYGLPPALIYAIIEQESGFNQYLESHADCHGLMQINFPVWQKELSISSREYLYDIGNNIKCGLYIFNKYKKQEEQYSAAGDGLVNDVELYRRALMRYFGLCKKAEKYAKKVLLIYERYTALT